MTRTLRQQGFSLVEVLLAVAIFGLFSTALIGLLINSYGSNYQSQDRTKATFYARQGLDAALSIRRQAWNLLVNGNYGLSNSSGYWQFSGSSDLSNGKYTRVVTVADACRNGAGDLVDCPGTSTDLHTKKITVTVTYTAITLVANQIQLMGYLSTWQSKDWVQTDWVGGSGQSNWSNATKYSSDDGNVSVSSSGQVTLASIAGSSCGLSSWPFTTASDYAYTPADIDVTGGLAQLKSSAGTPITGGTTNPSFTSNATGWTYSDWDQGGGEVNAAGTRQSSGGNPTGYVQINFPQGNGDQLGGYYEQTFTTTGSNPSSASINFDWQVSGYDLNPAPLNFRMYVFVDSASGAPTIGQQVWTSGPINSTSGWVTTSGIDALARMPTVGTYYLKIAVWLETPPSGGSSGPFTVGYDNVQLNWSSPGSAVYPSNRPTITPNNSYTVTDINSWSSFSETATKNGGEVYYQLSDTDGSTWQYWNGSAWAVTGSCAPSGSNCNTASVVNANIQSFPVTNKKILFKAFLSSNGSQLVQLDNVQISCAQNFDWPFTTASDYTYTPTDIDVTGGLAQLKSSAGTPITGGTTNPNFTSNATGWAYADWTSENTSNVANGTYQSSGGNPGGYVNVTIPASKNIRSGGYWQQAFTTTASNPTVTINLDWVVKAFQSGNTDFGVYVYVDSFSGNPVYGQEVWLQEHMTVPGVNMPMVNIWTPVTNINASSRVTTPGTYYLKIAGWVHIPNGPNLGPYTIGYDNVQLTWSAPGNPVYPSNSPPIESVVSASVPISMNLSLFSETANKNGGEVYYKLSNGTNWYWYNGGWQTTAAGTVGEWNTAVTMNANMSTFPLASSQLFFRAFLSGNGSQQVQLDNVKVGWTQVGTCSGDTPACEAYTDEPTCIVDVDCSWSAGASSGGYQTSGYLVSSAFNTGASSSFNLLSWGDTIPGCSPNCTVKFQVRTAPNVGGTPGAWSAWYGSGGPATYFTDKAGTVLSADLNFNQWVQYRVELAGDGVRTPTLQDVTINYTP